MLDDAEVPLSSAPPPRPVLPAHAGDLHFEYTPASPNFPSDGMGSSLEAEMEAMTDAGVAGDGMNRAPSPGGYTGSRSICVVRGSGRHSCVLFTRRHGSKRIGLNGERCSETHCFEAVCAVSRLIMQLLILAGS